MARPKGAINKDKPFRAALQMELLAAGEDHKKLRRIARALISEAETGNMQAIKEIADRLDGRAHQQVEHTGADGGPIETQEVAPRQLAQAVLGILASAELEDERPPDEALN